MKQQKKLPLIFTDLDGSLLDHSDYSYVAAKPALAEIKHRSYPLIFNSSKTRAEILPLQRGMEIVQPFVCENGAAVYVPEPDGWRRHSFSQPRQQLLSVLQKIRQQYGFEFQGFADWSVEEIAAQTGLSHPEAALAAQREFTEPLLWQDSATRLEDFQQCLAEYHLHAVQGGRFLSVMGEFDKCVGMQWLIDLYREEYGDIVTVALGDSPNDEQMLNAADIAVIIHSRRSDKLEVNAARVIRTELAGSAGWAWAMQMLLNEWENS